MAELLSADASVAAAFALARQAERDTGALVGSPYVARFAANRQWQIAFAAGRAVAEIRASQHGEGYGDKDISPAETFDLPGIFDALQLPVGSVKYMVFFISKRSESVDDFMLTFTDRLAHDEAADQLQGGLLLYVRGEKEDITTKHGVLIKDASESCCLWDSAWQAQVARDGTMHGLAMGQTGASYTSQNVQVYWAFRTAEDVVELVRPQDLNAEQLLITDEANCRAQQRAILPRFKRMLEES